MTRYLSRIQYWVMILSGVFILITSAFAHDQNDDESINLNFNAQPTKLCREKGPFPPPPIVKRMNLNTSVITLWFDDGWISQFKTAYPIMEKYHYPGTIAVAIRFVCLPGFINWQQLRFLQAKGWETTSHSVSHSCDFGYYTTQSTQYELLESKKRLISEGLRANHFVMPCGYSQEQIDNHFVSQHPPIIETAQKYYQSYRTTTLDNINLLPILVHNRYNLSGFEIRNTTTDKDIQNAINQALKKKSWLIFVFHQIDDSQNTFAISPQRFEQILKQIQQSHLPVVVPSQILGPGDR